MFGCDNAQDIGLDVSTVFTVDPPSFDFGVVEAELTYWRSTSGFEVDFILEGTIAIEVKSADLIQDRHLKGLFALKEEGNIRKSIIVCFEKRPRKYRGIDIMPWDYFLDKLWKGEIITG